MTYQPLEYDFTEIEQIVSSLSDMSHNRLEYYILSLDLLKLHYTKLSTIYGKLSGITMLCKSVAGQKGLMMNGQQVVQAFTDLGTVQGYISLIDKATIIAQSIAKHTIE